MRAAHRLRLFALGLTVAIVISTLPFVWSRPSSPGPADAVVVLSGDHGERLAKGLELMREGLAPTLVLDGQPDFAQVAELCGGGETFEVVCLRPDPDSTRAEARAAGRLAADRGWKTMIVVTTTYHTTRAGMLFRRCVDGSVATVGAVAPYGRWKGLRQVAHEWLGVAYALTLARAC